VLDSIDARASRSESAGSLSAGALVEVLACLADWDARPARGGADVGDLLQQFCFGPAVDGCRARTAYCSLAFCRPRKAHSGRCRSRSPPGPAARPGWPRTTPARRRPGEGAPRRGTCRFAGAGAQARSAPRRCQRRVRARRAGHDGLLPPPRQSDASCRACDDGRPGPSAAGGLCGRQLGPGTRQRGETCSLVTLGHYLPGPRRALPICRWL
jgi:hypothetical protein